MATDIKWPKLSLKFKFKFILAHCIQNILPSARHPTNTEPARMSYVEPHFSLTPPPPLFKLSSFSPMYLFRYYKVNYKTTLCSKSTSCDCCALLWSCCVLTSTSWSKSYSTSNTQHRWRYIDILSSCIFLPCAAHRKWRMLTTLTWNWWKFRVWLDEPQD